MDAKTQYEKLYKSIPLSFRESLRAVLNEYIVMGYSYKDRYDELYGACSNYVVVTKIILRHKIIPSKYLVLLEQGCYEVNSNNFSPFKPFKSSAFKTKLEMNLPTITIP